jgi:hypothetical protein
MLAKGRNNNLLAYQLSHKPACCFLLLVHKVLSIAFLKADGKLARALQGRQGTGGTSKQTQGI